PPHPGARRRRRRAPAGPVLRRVPRRPPPDGQSLEPLVAPPPREPGRRPPLLGLGEPLLEQRRVERGEPRLQRRDLPGELLGPLRRGRLERERPDPRPHLGLPVARPPALGRHTP